jgi:hypothetical protein
MAEESDTNILFSFFLFWAGKDVVEGEVALCS